jgi:Ca2+-binding RTX toxin-like protein
LVLCRASRHVTWTKGIDMFSKHLRRTALIGVALVAPLLTAVTAEAVGPPPEHNGDPALWGPAVETLCDDPALAALAGYNVIEDPLGNAANNALVGTAAADAIYAYGGNDKVWGGPRDDVICGGAGNDKLRGEQGSDAVFGEGHADTVHGDKSPDFVDGGNQIDACDGGLALDAEDDCETVTSVP